MKTNNNVGFTLIELLVVVLIIGILAAVALPQYTKAVEKSRTAEVVTMLGDIMTGERIYQLSTGKYTVDLSALDIEVPGTLSTTTAENDTATTTNYKVVLTGGDGADIVATATRQGSNPAGAYALELTLETDGDLVRQCTNGNTVDICASMPDWPKKTTTTTPTNTTP